MVRISRRVNDSSAGRDPGTLASWTKVTCDSFRFRLFFLGLLCQAAHLLLPHGVVPKEGFKSEEFQGNTGQFLRHVDGPD